MNKGALTVMFGAFLTGTGVPAAHAGSIHISVDVCNVVAARCSTFEAISDGMIVEASGRGGNWSLRCHSQLPAESPLPTKGRARCNAANTGDMPCETVFGDTTDWEEVVSPSGHVSLTCHGTGS